MNMKTMTAFATALVGGYFSVAQAEALTATATSVAITGAQQRYPWNGKVDVDFSVSGLSDTRRGLGGKDADGVDYTEDGITYIPGDYLVIDLLTGEQTQYRNVKTPEFFNTEEYKRTKMAFRRVPAGKFRSVTRNYSSGTVTNVVELSTYYIAIFPVTSAQYNAVKGGRTDGSTGNQTQGSITWNGFRGGTWNGVSGDPEDGTFVAILNERMASDRFRVDLCTDYQWQRAARAGTRAAYFCDNTIEWPSDTNPPANLGEFANYLQTGGVAKKAVGALKPNAWGLYDVYGDTEEVCRDWAEDISGKVLPKDYAGAASGIDHPFHGGYYYSGASACSSVFTYWVSSTGGNDDNFGHRLSIELKNPVAEPASSTPRYFAGLAGRDPAAEGDGIVDFADALEFESASGKITADGDYRLTWDAADSLAEAAKRDVELFAQLHEVEIAADGVTFIPGDYVEVDVATATYNFIRDVRSPARFNRSDYQGSTILCRIIPRCAFRSVDTEADVELGSYAVSVYPMTDEQAAGCIAAAFEYPELAAICKFDSERPLEKENAERAGTVTTYFYGDSEIPDYAHPNAYGLYDVSPYSGYRLIVLGKLEDFPSKNCTESYDFEAPVDTLPVHSAAMLLPEKITYSASGWGEVSGSGTASITLTRNGNPVEVPAEWSALAGEGSVNYTFTQGGMYVFTHTAGTQVTTGTVLVEQGPEMYILDQLPAGSTVVTNDGVYTFTLAADATGPICIPDNLGAVIFNLAGHAISGANGRAGTANSAGTAGQPAIIITASGAEGSPTYLSIKGGAVVGGSGGNGNPFGEGAPAFAVESGAKTGADVVEDTGAAFAPGAKGTDLLLSAISKFVVKSMSISESPSGEKVITMNVETTCNETAAVEARSFDGRLFYRTADTLEDLATADPVATSISAKYDWNTIKMTYTVQVPPEAAAAFVQPVIE